MKTLWNGGKYRPTKTDTLFSIPLVAGAILVFTMKYMTAEYQMTSCLFALVFYAPVLVYVVKKIVMELKNKELNLFSWTMALIVLALIISLAMKF